MTPSDESVSSYLTTDYEGISTTFTEISVISSGGHCNLYRAKRYGRLFLLKCLKPELCAEPVYQQMLRKEFEILMRLQHPSILQAVGIEPVTLPDYQEAAMCMITEWIDGYTLDEYLASHPTQTERRRIALELAEALAYIHSQQIVHRDLKPSNIMVTHNGHYLKIIDFGLSDTDSHAILKQPAGTLKYMPPEQAQQTVPDVRNDIYSLGIILQEINLRGHRYNKVVEKCLRPIHQRYQNMEELLDDLHNRHKRHWQWIAAGMTVLSIIAALILQIDDLRRKALEQERHTAALNLQIRILNNEIIDFEDPHAKLRCIQLWDTDHDKELSYPEAASVHSLGNAFTKDTLLRSFNELKHFTGLTDIGEYAFYGCNHLQTIQIPRTIRYIRQNALRGTAIETITIPSSVAAIGDHILDDCPQLETVVFETVLPNTNIGSRPLANCPKLSAIFVPRYWLTPEAEKKSWKELADNVTHNIPFRDPTVKQICASLWDRNGDHELSIDEAASVTSLGAAFSGNTAIRSFDELKYFTGLTEIESSAFDRCRHLQSIRLPRNINSIGQNAFLDCDLHAVYISAKITKIAATAFSCNPHLASIIVSPDNAVYDSREHCNAIIETSTNQMITGSITATIPRSVTSLSDECFNWFNRDELILPLR